MKKAEIKNKLIGLTNLEKHHFFFENTADAILVADSKTRRIVECNKTAEKFTGYTRKEILSMKVDKFHPQDKIKETILGFKKQIKYGGTLRTEILTKNKKRIPVSVNSRLIKIDKKSYLLGVFRDITNVIAEEKITIDKEERFHGLFEHANDAIWLMEKNTFIDCNIRAVTMFKCKDKKDMVNHTPMDFSPTKQPDGQYSKKKALIYIKKALNDEPQRFYWQHKKKDGTLFDTEISLNRIILHGNLYVQAMGRDVSERKKIELEREQYFKFFELSTDIMVIADPLGCFKRVNSACLRILGYSEKDLLKKPFVDFIHPDDKQSTKDEMARQMKLGYSLHFENRYMCKDGSVLWLSWQANYDKHEGITYATARDITERKRAEESIKRINRAIRMVSGINQTLIHFSDPKELLNEACRIAVEVGGYSLAWVGYAEQDKEKSIRPVAYAGKGINYVKNVKLTWAETLRGRGPSGLAIRTMKFHISRLISKDKTMTPWQKNAKKYGYKSSIALPLINNKKAFGMIAIYSNEIDSFDDEEVKILDELSDDIAFGITTFGVREDASKFKKAAETSGEVVYLTNTDGIITFINSEFTKTFGYTSAEVVDRVTPRILKSGLRKKQEYVNFWKDLFAGKVVKDEHYNKTKDGRILMIESVTSPIFDEKKKIIGFLAVQHDITERKKTEEKLRENEERFRNIFNYSAVGVSVLNTRGHWLEVNDALCKITGYSRKELLGENFSDITFVDDRPKGIDVIKKIMSGEINYAQFDKRYIHKNGRIVWVNISTALVRDSLGKPLYFVTHTQDITKLKENEQKYQRLFESAKDPILILDSDSGEIKDSNPFVQDLLGYTAIELIGKKIFEISPFRDIIENKEKFLELQKKGYVYYDNLPLKTKSGVTKQVEFVSNVYLVNDKKVIQCNIRDITERIKKEKELDQAKNDFLSMASHQLRTPLSAVKWVLETLENAPNFTPQQKEKINNLVISNERIINLVNYLLDVTKIESGKLVINKKETDVRELFDKLYSALENLANNKKKNINIIIPSQIKSIYCDSVFLYEALSNLIHNAIIYSKEDSKNIDVKISEREDDYLVSVHNDGVMDDITLSRIKIFDKFVRGNEASRAKPEGSGLGLYLAKSIAESSGGKLWCESNTESGTTFFLTIIKEKAKR